MSDDIDRDELEQRLERLEDGLERIEQNLDAVVEAVASEPRKTSEPPPSPPLPDRPAPTGADGDARSADDSAISTPTPPGEQSAGAPSPETRDPTSGGKPFRETTSNDIDGFDGADGSVDDASYRPAPSDEEQPGLESDFSDWLRVEQWVDKIGVGLLLLGLAFLYRLSVEQGLITPAIRVGFGLTIGVALGLAGWRVRSSRLRLSQILVGAASVTFYVSLFAAYQMYELLPYAISFGAMTAVVMATFILANAIRDPALAVVGAIGGFATPLLLTSDGSIPGLMTYNAILVVGMTAIYVARGWRHILMLTALGSWAFVIYAGFSIFLAPSAGDVIVGNAEPLDGPEPLFAQVSLLITWFCVGIVPTVRCWLWAEQREEPEAIPTLIPGLMATASGFFGFALTLAIWDVPSLLWALLGLGLAGAYAGASVVLAQHFEGGLASAHRLLAVIFLVIGCIEAAPDGYRWLLMAFALVIAHLFAIRCSDRAVTTLAHLVTIPVVYGLIQRLDDAASSTDAAFPFVNAIGLETAAIIGCIIATSFVIERHLDGFFTAVEHFIYRCGVHILILAWIGTQAHPFAQADLIVSAGWSIYAVGLLIAGLLRGNDEFKGVGLAVVVLTVAKLLVVDLQQLETGWRVVLFLGFGAALVAISYFSPLLTKTSAGDDDLDTTGT